MNIRISQQFLNVVHVSMKVCVLFVGWLVSFVGCCWTLSMCALICSSLLLLLLMCTMCCAFEPSCWSLCFATHLINSFMGTTLFIYIHSFHLEWLYDASVAFPLQRPINSKQNAKKTQTIGKNSLVLYKNWFYLWKSINFVAYNYAPY